MAYVENVLYEHPSIDGAAVVAVPDPRLQERACACVVLSPAASLTFDEMKEDPERQDPEVPAPRAGGRVTACLVDGVRTPL